MATMFSNLFGAIMEFCGWRKKVALTPEQQQIQQVRKEVNEEIAYNHDAVKYGVNPDGSVRKHDDK